MMQVAYIVCRGFFTGRLVYLEQILHDVRVIFNELFHGGLLWLFPGLRARSNCFGGVSITGHVT